MSTKSTIALGLSFSLTLIFFLVGLHTINDYSETTDEKSDLSHGDWYYYHWKTSGLSGLEQSFSLLERNYGPLFAEISVVSHDYLNLRFHLLKPVASYHFPVLIISSLSIFCVFWFAYVNQGLAAGLLAALTLGLMPRFIGDSQNNLKDTPLMFFFMVTIMLFHQAITKNKTIFYLLAGLFLGLTYCIKINALIVLPILAIWYGLTHHPLDLKSHLSFVSKLLLSLAVAFLTIVTVWPYYRYSPIQRFVETYQAFKDHEWNDYTLYLGTHYHGHDVPWHYPFVMLGITMPIGYLFFFLLALALLVWARSSYLLLLVLWFLLPPLIQALSPAPMYDGIRHFLLSLPAIALLIASSMNFILLASASHQLVHILLISLVASIFITTLLTDIRFHPYQIVYFNHLVGGVRGAYGKFDLDYWGQSFQEAANWIDTHLPTGSKIMTTVPMDHHFPIDHSRFTLTRDDPDYKVNLMRGMLKTWDPEPDYLHPKLPPIYSIIVDGAPILSIFSLHQ